MDNTMNYSELMAFEKYYEDMWKMHCRHCVNSGFMTQTREQFRVNMLGFWELNKKHNTQQEENQCPPTLKPSRPESS